MFFGKLRSAPTFFKYLLSYVLAFTVLIFCFFWILRGQLTEAYSQRQADRVTTQMEAAVTHLFSEISFLAQTDSLITSSADIKLATYRAEGKYIRITAQELRQYSSTSSLIEDIVYYSRFNGYVFSKTEYVTHEDGIFRLKDARNNDTIFDPAPYMDAKSGQLIWLDDGETEHLFYFPPNRSGAYYIYFYLLDTKVIQSQLNTLLSNEVLAVALLDGNGGYVTGTGFEPYENALEGSSPTQGVHPLAEGTSLYISSPIQDGFALATVVSGDALKDQVNTAYVHSYLSMLGLGLLGVCLVYVAMLFTYRPLHRLMEALGHETGRHQNYLEVISKNYSELIQQKAQLEQSLAEYRESLAARAEHETLEYPHEELGSLSACLREHRFSDARALVEALLSRPDSSPGYFLGCILLDCLTIITNSMSRARIEYEAYSEIFTQAVQQCRNIRHIQDLEGLKALIHELLFFYEQEIGERSVQAAPLKAYVERRFSDPDFSIGEIAEAYHVSLSRMSSLFKEAIGMGFLEYVWKMRLEKAQELLRNTELSVDEISVAVGYLAATSFSRKFKQATGMTPSQYRAKSINAE